MEEKNDSVLDFLRDKDYSSAIASAEELFETATEQENIYFIVQSHYLRGFAYIKLQDYGKAVIHYLEGARYSETSKDLKTKKVLINLYKDLGSIMYKYKHYELAHKFNKKGINVAASIGNTHQIISLQNNELHGYLEEEKYLEAINQIEGLFNKYDLDSARIISFKNKLGISYKNMGERDKAIEAYQFVIDNGMKIAPDYYAYALYNMGLIYFESGDYETSLDYLIKSLDFRIKENLTSQITETHEYVGLTFWKLGQDEKALNHFLEAESSFIKDYSDPDQFRIFKTISNFYLSHEEPDLTIKYENIYIDHLEAFIAQQKEIEELDKKYNMELLTQRYFDLLAAEERHRETLRTAQFGLGSGIALLLAILFYIAYRRYRNRMEIAQRLRAIEHDSLV